ncbi:MAG: hypothetical protein FWC75_06835, partial [Oscillospiraceae bacterium]|nr:hypothetical protein [Oscillospiraceae bacterium]
MNTVILKPRACATRAPYGKPQELHEIIIPFSWLFCALEDVKGMIVFMRRYAIERLVKWKNSNK